MADAGGDALLAAAAPAAAGPPKVPDPKATKAQWVTYGKKMEKYAIGLKADAAAAAGGDDEDSGTESEDGEPMTDAEKKAIKLTEPDGAKFEGTRAEYRGWRRRIRRWYRLRRGLASARTLGSLLMGNLSGEAYEFITSVIKAKDESYDKVMAALAEEFGEDQLERSIRVTKEIDSFERKSGEGLDEFLKRYTQIRARAMEHGWTPSKKTEGGSLLARAKLGESANLSLLQQLERKKCGTTYAAVKQELKTLSTVQKIPGASEGEGSRKRGADASALVTAEVKRLRKEVQVLAAAQTGPGKGPSATKEVCNHFQREGTCRYGDNCRFEHVKGGGGGGGGGGGKEGTGGGGGGGGGKPKGGKPKGGKPKGVGKGVGKGSGSGKGPRLGDWLCPKCADLQFAANTSCRKCSTAKPSGLPGPPPKKEPAHP